MIFLGMKLNKQFDKSRKITSKCGIMYFEVVFYVWQEEERKK